MEHPDVPDGPKQRANPVADARAELALGPGADQAEIRAAYLRLLKTRKPEVDPDGFRRLRAAYDLLRGLSAFLPETSSLGGGAPRDFAPAPAPMPAEAGATPPEVAEESEESEFESAGHGGEGEAPPGPTIGSVGSDGADRDPELEARAMCLAYARASGEPGVRVPPPPFVLDTMLRLYAIGSVDLAIALGRALHGWFEATGTESRYLRDGAAVRWAVLRDLAMLPNTVPHELRAAIAEATRRGDLLRARAACMNYREAARGDATRLAEVLRARAPTLHAMLGSYLIYAPAPAPARSRRGATWLIFVGIMALNALRTLASAPSTESPSPNEPPTYNRSVIDAALAGLSEATASSDCAEMESRADEVSTAMRAPGAWPTPDQRARLSQLIREGRTSCPQLQNGKQR